MAKEEEKGSVAETKSQPAIVSTPYGSASN